MPAHTENTSFDGLAGLIDCAIDWPEGVPTGWAQGGTRDNKVVTTLSRACVQQGLVSLRPNFRGIGTSGGHFDHGKGELLDMAALVEQFRARYPEIAAKPWVLGGFSFGTSIGVQLYAQWDKLGKNLPNIVILTGSAALRFRHSEAKAPEDALVIHGELDEVVPLSEVMEWARPLGMPVVVIPEAGHFFHGKLLVLRQLVQTRLKVL
jgi:alpha/beta superfamily hydrolase